MQSQTLERLRRHDQARPGFPGEHWIAFAAGVALWLATRNSRSMAVKVAAGIAGSLLVTRALTGRDGLGQRVSWLPSRD